MNFDSPFVYYNTLHPEAVDHPANNYWEVGGATGKSQAVPGRDTGVDVEYVAAEDVGHLPVRDTGFNWEACGVLDAGIRMRLGKHTFQVNIRRFLRKMLQKFGCITDFL